MTGTVILSSMLSQWKQSIPAIILEALYTEKVVYANRVASINETLTESKLIMWWLEQWYFPLR